MCYVIARDTFGKGCIALKTKHGKELTKLKSDIYSALTKSSIQLVTISRPSAYGEYEPYKIVSTPEQFKEEAMAL